MNKTQWTENPFINAEHGSSVSSSITVGFGEKIKPWLMAVAFMISIAGNFWFAILYLQQSHQNSQDIATALRKDAVAQDLNSNDFTFFKQNDWVHLQAEVETTKMLVAAKCRK